MVRFTGDFNVPHAAGPGASAWIGGTAKNNPPTPAKTCTKTSVSLGDIRILHDREGE
ncbi:MAG: hypothetical protein P8L18_02540 [Verrucomicrobiota bacterium]|jgi:hypothetical protein|nr:hypothetical protein [Verrucomicrobiota bacterium]